MRKYFFPYIASLLLLPLVFIACNSNPQTATANPNPLFTDEQKAVAASQPLHYVDTTKPEYKVIRQRVDAFMNSFARSGFNGSILVGSKGQVVYERYFGMANRETGLKLLPNSSVQLASISKTFTGTAVLYLHQHKFLDITERVQEYIPDFPYNNITVKMLLNHRSGLPNYLYYMEEKGWDRNLPATNEDVLRTLAEWKPNKAFTAGKRYNYCNTNYVVLASIIERVSGVPYPQYMEDNFFDPLQMHHSFVKTIADTAVVYSYQPNGAFWTLDFSDGPYGDKNIYSTPRDLLKWDQALYHGKIISPALLDSAFKPYSHEKAGTKNYGLGWHLLMLPNDKKVIYHNGRWHGFNSAFARLTDEKVTIIIAGNKYNPGVYRASKKMYNLFGPYDGRDVEQEEDGG